MPLFVRTPCAGAELLLLSFVIRCCVVMSPRLLSSWPSKNCRKVIMSFSYLSVHPRYLPNYLEIIGHILFVKIRGYLMCGS